jgi:excisionase family DNA binding protein
MKDGLILEAIMEDYKDRSYLSAVEAAKYLGVSVGELHELVRAKKLDAKKATSGQYRFTLEAVRSLEESGLIDVQKTCIHPDLLEVNRLAVENTIQTIYVKNSQYMFDIPDNSVHLMLTSPPYFNAKMYSKDPIDGDIGNIHDLDSWFSEINKVWSEVYRVLQPGRKAFINIMNLPIRIKGTFKSLNLVGRTIENCEELGFVFKRDIVWHKTNSVRAHFGTYPYPGGILLNHAHEFILEFEKPAPKNYNKYGHLTPAQKESSKLDKDFWTTIKKSDVWLMSPHGSGDRRCHAAPFPTELPERLIRAYSYMGETVLDPFLGSGTTLMVASELGRNGVGYEINSTLAGEAIVRIKNEL